MELFIETIIGRLIILVLRISRALKLYIGLQAELQGELQVEFQVEL
jgi:hypothetical protein